MVKISEIEAALGRIESIVHCTPVLTNSTVDELAGRNLFFKAENLQKTGSFKARGALNAVSNLSSEVTAVCCDSSGNHGQALSWAAKSLGKICHVAVPEGAPAVKVAAIENYGGKVHFCEPNDTGREAKRNELVEKYNAKMIHPSQNFDVIAGQGTIGLELADQFDQPFDAIIIPVGGGGLISGIATALRANWPDVKIIAAEPEAVDDCAVSKKAGKLIVTQKSDTVCDGVRTNVGKNTWPMIQELVDDVSVLLSCRIYFSSR